MHVHLLNSSAAIVEFLFKRPVYPAILQVGCAPKSKLVVVVVAAAAAADL